MAIDWQSVGTELPSLAPGKVAHSPANCSLQIPEGMLWVLGIGMAVCCAIGPMLEDISLEISAFGTGPV